MQFGLGVGEAIIALDEGGVCFDAFFGVVGGGGPVLFASVACAGGVVRVLTSLNQ